MEKKYFIFNNSAWFCISLYYSRNDWGRLLGEIRLFYESKNPLFERCLLYLSEERGESVQIEFSLTVDNDSDPAYLQCEGKLKKLAATSPDSFLYLYTMICDHFGVIDTLRLMILYLWKAWRPPESNNE